MPRSRILDCVRAVLYVSIYCFLSLERFNLLFIVVWNENVPWTRIHAERVNRALPSRDEKSRDGRARVAWCVLGLDKRHSLHYIPVNQLWRAIPDEHAFPCSIVSRLLVLVIGIILTHLSRANASLSKISPTTLLRRMVNPHPSPLR